MKDRDFDIVDKYLKENLQTIEDRGFSDRVMKNLPKKISYYNSISALSILIGVLLFIYLGGYSMVVNAFKTNVCLDIPNVELQNMNTTNILSLAFVFLFFVVRECYDFLRCKIWAVLSYF